MDNELYKKRNVCEFTDEDIGFLQDLLKEHKENVERDYFFDRDGKQEEDEWGERQKYVKTLDTIQKITDKVDCAREMSNDDWWDGWFTAKKESYEMYGCSGETIIQDIEECDELDRNDPDDRDEIKRIFDRFVSFTGEKYDVDKDEVYTV